MVRMTFQSLGQVHLVKPYYITQVKICFLDFPPLCDTDILFPPISTVGFHCDKHNTHTIVNLSGIWISGSSYEKAAKSVTAVGDEVDKKLKREGTSVWGPERCRSYVYLCFGMEWCPSKASASPTMKRSLGSPWCVSTSYLLFTCLPRIESSWQRIMARPRLFLL